MWTLAPSIFSSTFLGPCGYSAPPCQMVVSMLATLRCPDQYHHPISSSTLWSGFADMRASGHWNRSEATSLQVCLLNSPTQPATMGSVLFPFLPWLEMWKRQQRGQGSEHLGSLLHFEHLSPKHLKGSPCEKVFHWGIKPVWSEAVLEREDFPG